MTIPFTVIGGYLGAGKTTLLNRLIKGADGRRIALIINDFGAINIDAALIDSRTEQQINLTNGCICCGLSDGFDAALETLLDSQPPPDHIVVEASGVADVASLAQYGRGPGVIPNGIIVLADAETVEAKARDKYVASTVRRQLTAADLLVLNKADLVEPGALHATRAWLETLAPGAVIIETRHADLPVDLILGAQPVNRRSAREPSSNADDHTPHEHYQTWSYESTQALTAAQISAFLQGLPAHVVRGKGFFRTDDGMRLWQRVGRRDELTNPAHTGQDSVPAQTTLVAIAVATPAMPALSAALDALAATTLSAG